MKILMGNIVNFEGRKLFGWSSWLSRLELEAKTDGRRSALDKRVVEEE